MPGDETVDVNQSRDRFRTRKAANAHEVRRLRPTIDAAEVLFRHKMCFVADGWILRDTALELARPLPFANELNPQPSVTMWFDFGQCLRNGSRANLRHNSEEIRESNRNAHKAPDLPDAIPVAVYERETGHRVLAQNDAYARALDILNGT